MRFDRAIDAFCEYGSLERGWSKRTIESYAAALVLLCEDVDNRDPSKVGADDIRRWLRRWANATRRTRAKNLAAARSFFDWAVKRELATHNPARQVERPRPEKPHIVRLSVDEVQRMLDNCVTLRERLAIGLLAYAGLRRAELAGLTWRHVELDRDLIVVSSDIAKGSRARVVPIVDELRGVLEVARSEPAAHVIPSEKPRRYGTEFRLIVDPTQPASPQAIFRLVKRVAERAGVGTDVGPHTLRHAFATVSARASRDLKATQQLLGHARLDTTQTYLAELSPEDLRAAMRGFSYQRQEASVLSLKTRASNPQVETVGIEPTLPVSNGEFPLLDAWIARQIAKRVPLYVEAFGG